VFPIRPDSSDWIRPALPPHASSHPDALARKSPRGSRRVNGHGRIVATNDLTLADNLIYKDGLTNTGSSTADMLGLVAQRDIWYGDPRYGTFVEGSGIMLAGRDFNFVFLDNGGNPKPPDNSIILNGTMLATCQVAVFRDFADPSGVNFANSWKDWQECPPCS
jgi:hypothetical protein